MHIIPALVVHRWDFTKHPVCERAYELLTRLYSQPTVNLLVHNFQVYCDVESVNDVRKIRERLIIVRDYLMTCRHRRTLLMAVAGRRHLLDEVHLYSLQDLEEAYENRLLPYLTNIYRNYQAHVLQCEFCRSRGFYCEICNTDDLLFSFQFERLDKCRDCAAVFHKQCWRRVCARAQRAGTEPRCPRCERKKRIMKERGSATTSHSSSTDLMQEYDASKVIYSSHL